MNRQKFGKILQTSRQPYIKEILRIFASQIFHLPLENYKINL